MRRIEHLPTTFRNPYHRSMRVQRPSPKTATALELSKDQHAIFPVLWSSGTSEVSKAPPALACLDIGGRCHNNHRYHHVLLVCKYTKRLARDLVEQFNVDCLHHKLPEFCDRADIENPERHGMQHSAMELLRS